MNSPDNQQYGSFARDDVDVVNKGLIDIDSIQTDVDLFLKKSFMKNGKHQFHSLVMSLMKKMTHVPSL
jgi:hypothetical protein